MNITVVSSPEVFAEKAESLLLKKEACNNLMLGLLNRLLENGKTNAEYYLGYVEINNQVIFAFMRTAPNNWIMADVDHVADSVIASVANFMFENNLEVPGILGPVRSTNLFVNKWTELTDGNASVHMEQLIYQLDKVNHVPMTDGILVEANRAHHALLTQWLEQFGLQANETITASKAARTAINFINNRTVYLWEVEGVPVSMVNQSRKTKHGATINAVFTPDEFKRKGYATSAVAALSRRILEDGFQFCSLYTDKANPTSNSIYKKIGYYVVGDSIVYKFN
ncbi:GNAT family N-acetyltransferase [Virgibacillus oceani]|uniref:Acetyltransferase n=1 Tax=Virgibacillus oceani TaxID=1479511 RepID=A0A917M140_9BACI|nr:GNAT family N-acetyltransferase [Virgibacillus oceani]GGG71053.1 acetyltransferase [Virgibacillus oceani]